MLPLWAVLLAAIFSKLSNTKHALPTFMVVAAIALLSHILTDTLTTWGTQILWPISDYKASLETSFFIDPIMTLLVLIPLLIALYWNKNSIALIGVALLVLVTRAQVSLRGPRDG